MFYMLAVRRGRMRSHKSGRRLFKELSRTRKLSLAMILVVCGLVFYGVGIATNFFGSPAFSMFFIISYQTAQNLAYWVLTVAVVLSILAALSMVETRETHTVSNSHDEQNEDPIIALSPTFERLADLEEEKTEQKACKSA